MSTTLIATVVALVLGHLAPAFAASVRHYGWFGDWVGWLNARCGEVGFWRGPWGLVMALSLPLLVVLFFQYSLRGFPFGLASFLFGIAVLFYTWGPRDLDRDVNAVAAATDPVERREAAARLSDDGQVALDPPSLVESVFRNALRRWFGVLFWFLVLGPFGAMLYRLVVLAVAGAVTPRVPARAARGGRMLLAVLEWPVAQLMTLALALVANFDTVLAAWRAAGGASFQLNHRFLVAAGRASVRSELAEEAGDYVGGDSFGDSGVAAAPVTVSLTELPELRDAMSLIWRCLLVWLAALALFVIAGFVN